MSQGLEIPLDLPTTATRPSIFGHVSKFFLLSWGAPQVPKWSPAQKGPAAEGGALKIRQALAYGVSEYQQRALDIDPSHSVR